MKNLLVLLFGIGITLCKAQSFQSLDTIKPPASYENIYNRPVFPIRLPAVLCSLLKKK
jgi:hypothetical protein